MVQPVLFTPAQVEARRPQMFPKLGDAQIARVRKFGKETTFDAGSIVWEQGDDRVPFYVVLDGELELIHPDCRGETLVSILGPKEFTGEVHLLTDRRTLVRGRARTRLRVVRIERTRFRTLIENDADLSELLMRAFILRRVFLLSGGLGDAILLGSRDSAETLRLQAFLTRNSHPYRYVDVVRDADVQTILDHFHVGVSDVPVLVCRGERVLRRPTEAEVADCLGFNPAIDPRVVHDVVVCGAGPGGLAAAVYGASEGLDVLVLEAEAPGGQAAGSSKIENYLGFPTGISGQALGARAFAQAEKFGARVLVARGALRLHCDRTPYTIEIAGEAAIRTRSVVIATGAEYRKLEVADLSRFEGVGVYYAATYLEAQRCETDDVIVVGGGNSAGQAATFLARASRHVHMLIRGPDLAASMSRYLIRRIEETPNITLRRRTSIVALSGHDHLEEVTWRDGAGALETRPIRHVFSMAGAKPNCEWLAGCVATDPRGFIETGTDLDGEKLRVAGWPVGRLPYLFETSRPRVFAIGDVRANSVKRVASAVGEGSVCIQLVHKVLSE